MMRYAPAFAGFLMWAAAGFAADAPPDARPPPRPDTVVEQPRAFGYVVGDVLEQRVLLELDGRGFEPAAVPRAERVSAWLERRPPRIEPAADGRRWLVVEYQVVNAPRSLMLVRVPAWRLNGRSAARSLQIPEWPISVSALTPRSAFAQGGLEALRPDRPAPMIATDPIRRRVATWSGALMATAGLWLGWLLWRNWRATATQPFASALREIRRTDERAPEAWQALHRAFDRTAGSVAQTSTLPALFRQAPHLIALRPKIERFFQQSNERFFGRGLPDDALSVRELCTELRRIEKSHER
jgi:mxaA protein